MYHLQHMYPCAVIAHCIRSSQPKQQNMSSMTLCIPRQNKSQGNSPPDFFWNHNPTQFMQLCIHKWPLTAIFYHLHSFCQSHHLRFLTLTKGEHASNSRAKHESQGWRSTKKHPTGKFIETPYVLIQSGFPEIIFDEELGSSIGCGNTDTHII